MSSALTRLGSSMERKLIHAIHRGGRVVQHRAEVMSERAGKAVRRGSLMLAMGILGFGLLVAAWVVFNVALYDFLASHWSRATANLVVAGVQLLGSIIALIVAASMKAPAPRPLRLQPRRLYVRRYRTRRPESVARAAETEEEAGPPSLAGDTIRLAFLAMRTIPRLVHALRRDRDAV